MSAYCEVGLGAAIMPKVHTSNLSLQQMKMLPVDPNSFI